MDIIGSSFGTGKTLVMTVKSALEFIREVRVEFSKVLWPKFDDFIGSSIIVLILVSFFAVYLGAIDMVFSRLAHIIFRYGIYSA